MEIFFLLLGLRMLTLINIHKKNEVYGRYKMKQIYFPTMIKKWDTPGWELLFNLQKADLIKVKYRI